MSEEAPAVNTSMRTGDTAWLTKPPHHGTPPEEMEPKTPLPPG